MVVKLKNISLPPTYWERIKVIRNYLGVSSDSEVVRRVIDFFIDEKIEKRHNFVPSYDKRPVSKGSHSMGGGEK